MTRSLTLAALLLGLSVPAARAEMVRYDLDPDHVVVAFLVKHLGYENVLGTFAGVTGHFLFDPETRTLGAVEVSVGADTVDTRHEARDGHVKSADFLNVAAFPTITFTADGGTPRSETEGTVDGTVTILGVSKPLSLDVTLNKIAPYPFGHGKETVGISARGSLDRGAFGMSYGLAGEMVGDRIDLIIEAEAIRAE
jgi:polyisoprenoid-binding protein YceI